MATEQSGIEELPIFDPQEPREEHEKGEELAAQGKHNGIHRISHEKLFLDFSERSLVLTLRMIILQMTNTSGNFGMKI